MRLAVYRLILAILTIVACPFMASAQERVVENGVLVSTNAPRLALRVNEPFEYAGIHDFDIRGIAGGTRHVWLDAEGRRVKRMFIVQLEGFYPDNGGQYHYDLSNSPEVAGYRWRSNGWAFDLTETRRESPGNETSVTAEYLAGQGYELPEIVLMWRSLTVVNEARTHEAILFLMESADQHSLGLDDLFSGDEDTPKWQEIQKRMERDFHELLELAPLGDNGKPGGGWQRIPMSR